ncbi:hypothetical protein PSKAS_12300 [Peribacillus sp. N1]
MDGVLICSGYVRIYFAFWCILGVFPLVSPGNCPILQALLGNMSLIVQILYFSDIILRDLK